MGYASLVAGEPDSLDLIQTSHENGEHRAEDGQADTLLESREGSAKELASTLQDGTSSVSCVPMTIQACEHASEDALSMKTAENLVPELNGTKTLIENARMELENKNSALLMEGQPTLCKPSNQCKLTSVSTTEMDLEVEELKDTPSNVVSSVIEGENGRNFLKSDFEFTEKTDAEDRSANGVKSGSSKSSVEMPCESNPTQEAGGNTALPDQWQRDLNNFGVTEVPWQFAQGANKVNFSATVDGDYPIKTKPQSENLDDTTVTEDDKVPATSPDRTPVNIEPCKNICPSEDKTNNPQEDTLETVVYESEISDLPEDGKPEDDKEENGSKLDASVHPTLNENCLESHLDSDADEFADLRRHANMKEGRPSSISEEEQPCSINSWGWLDQGPLLSNPVTALVSDDMEGWHRFDIEEENANNMVYGTSVPNQESHQPQPWEQLLEDGVETEQGAKENEETISSVVLSGRESPASDHNFQTGLASPGNPFLEGLDRLSNFSEAEGFVFNNSLPSPRLSQSLETAAYVHAEENSRTSATGKEGFLLGANSGKQEIITPEVGRFYSTGSSLVDPCGNKLQSEASRHSFVGSAGSLQVSMDMYEAPSFMSLVDPESHELFKASMPTYVSKTNLPSQENGGKKWVANFDSMMPSQRQILSPQELTSISLPRVNTGDVSACEAPDIQTPVTSPFSKRKPPISPSRIWNSLSRKSVTPSASPRSRSSASSPKLSPLVRKMVQKVRTTPGVAIQALNASSKAMSPKTADDKTKQRPLWACCNCFSS